MAYAAYSEFLGASLLKPRATARHQPAFVVMDITVPSAEAHQVRRALARCTDTGVLRCVPRPQERLVRLEVHLPPEMVDEVMHCVIECVPCGQIGRICPWDQHLARHGLCHGV
jgi:hypothetical protein